MSYKLSNLTFMNKKTNVKLVEFDAPAGRLTNIFAANTAQRKFIKKVLKGQEKIARGRYLVDENDLVGGKFIKSKTAFISKDFWFERLIPPRVILTLSQLFDIKFLRQARIKKNDKKYDYLSFADSENDLNDMELRREIDQTISNFLDEFTKIEVKLIQNFRKKISQFHIDQTQKIFKHYYTQIQVLAQEYAYLELKIRTNNLLLTFFQILWDQIYSFNDLRSSCSCEYNVKKSSNKDIKKMKSKFTYKQTFYMVKKQLKMINIRTSELRLILHRDRKMANQILKQLRFETNKFHLFNKVPKDLQNKVQIRLADWKKIFEDLLTPFEKEQRAVFFKTLPQEGMIIKKRIIFLTHQYHTKVLSGSNKVGNKNEFKILKKHYKNEIESIYSQASNWTKENLKSLKIKFDWYLKNGFKLSSINIIYLKILKAINLKQNNIIFYNVFHLLTRKDYNTLMKTLKIINQQFPQLTFINLTDNFQTITSFNQRFYAVNHSHHLKLLTAEAIFETHARVIQEKFPLNWNAIPYLRAEHGITLENVFWPMKSKKLKDFGKVIINPFTVMLVEQTDVSNQLPLIIKVRKATRFLDKNMYLGVSLKGQKILFYSKKHLELNKEIVIFLQPNSIVGNI